MAKSRSVGDFIKPVVSLAPLAAQAAGVVNGPAIDRAGFSSCVVFAYTGADTGSPSARSLATKLQDSADGSTAWADISGAAPSDVTAVSSSQRKSIDLTVTTKQYIRVVHTVAFTGGTSPTLFVGSVVVLGGARTRPA